MASTTGILSSLCKVHYQSGEAETIPTSWTSATPIDNVQEVPDLGSAPETVDTTCLSDTNKKSIQGLVDYGSLEFTCLYDSGLYEELKALTTAQWWKIELNDALTTGSGTHHGSQFIWFGKPTVYLSSISVDNAVQFKLNIAVSSEMIFNAAE